ncbi:MAG: PEP-CTERM sorting domain-containing protein [Verrucomicrobiota bacterium JB022]|nr:PEP-CTERM sorting domain-containing protein [Verrucomicrobiota bacterium JB022]
MFHSLKSTLLLALLPLASLSASVSFEYSFLANSDTDNLGLNGSTFTFTMVSVGDTWETINDSNGVGFELASVQLTIANSSTLDGTYNLIQTRPTGQVDDKATGYLLGGGFLYLGLGRDGGFPIFEAEGADLTLTSSYAFTFDTYSPSVGDPIDDEAIAGVTLFVNEFTATSGGLSNTLGNLITTLNATPYTPPAVPEPAHAAALFGLGALGFIAWRRRRA